MPPVYGTYSMGHIPSGSELLHPFPFIRATRAVQIFILEFSKDGSADLEDEFTDGGAANQPVVQQGGVGLSSGQVSQGYGQFGYNFKWLPEIGDRFLDLIVNTFLDEVKKGMGHPDIIYVPWDVCVYKIRQEVAVASLFLSLKDPGHDPGNWWLSSSPVGWQGLRLC